MRRRLASVLSLAALALALSLALAACGATGDATDGAAFDGDGFGVRVPDGWQALATEPHAWSGSQTIALFSTQALDPQCDGPGVSSCRAPLEVLDDGSLLVWWVTAPCAGPACALPDGERLLVGGREARRIAGTGLCDELAATTEVAYVVAVSPQRLDAIVACDRDAGASVQAQLQSLIDSVDWRTP
ncbi:MAG TPA: hypothetical protein VFY43_03480 [Candidatus Limnocylindria bacterium]|nr:hypothetical protein [Candidatus Limnocylindria bacterium]